MQLMLKNLLESFKQSTFCTYFTCKHVKYKGGSVANLLSHGSNFKRQ